MRCPEISCWIMAGFLLAMFPQVRAAVAAPTADFYVAVNGSDQSDGSLQAPFATLSRAQQAVRQKIAAGLTGNVLVDVRGGTYELSAPLQFTDQDSGTAQYSVTYAAHPGETPVLSGGQRIQGWQNAGNNIWTVQLPDVKAGQWDFRQLFVNDQRAIVARTPSLAVSYGQVASTPNFSGTPQVVQLSTTAAAPWSNITVAPWQDLGHVELVTNNVFTNLRKPLQSVNTADNSLTLASPYIVPGTFSRPQQNFPVYLENAREFLDSPGEWYLNRQTGVLSYMPRSGEDMTNAAVYAPKLTNLLTVQGTASQSVQNLHFSGLQFEHADWPLPAQGFYGAQANVYRTADCQNSNPLSDYHEFATRPMDAAVQMHFVNNCSLENGAIKHVGGAALSLVEGVVNSLVQGNTISDIGGNGINVGDYNADQYAVGAGYVIPAALAVSGNKISDNNIHHVGTDYSGSVGLWMSFADGNAITHNLVHDVPYSGISLGFDWGSGDTPAKNNTVSFNHIYNVMQLMADGGGIYTLGKQPGTVLQNNLINGVELSPFAYAPINNAFFFDQSSAGISVSDNIAYDVSGDVYRYNATGDISMGANYWNIQPGDTQFPTALANQAGLEPQFLWMVPEPGMVVLLLTGVITLLLIAWRRKMLPGSRCILWLSTAALSITPAVGIAADVNVQKSDLFLARQGGYYTYRIPGIVRTLDGTLLVFVTGRDKDIWDYGNYDTVLRRSTDGGKTWSPMEVFIHSGKSTVDNCVLIVDSVQKGVVHNLYCVDYAHTYYRRSTDNAKTFSPPVEITKPFAEFASEYKYILQATGPGHGVQLENGRLLVPVWFSPRKEQFPSAVSVIYSDDHGDTWNRGPIIVRSGDPPNHPMEGVVAQLSDGRVMMNIRNEADAHRRAVSYSPNGVTDWTVPKFDPNLREPICFGSLLAVPRDIAGVKGVLLFLNPDNVERNVDLGPKRYCDRKNATVKMSLNDGADWAKSLVIEPGFSGYSDLCVGPDGTVYCLYERGAITSYYDPAAIALARFNLRELRTSVGTRRVPTTL